MKIKHLHLENFRCLKDFEADFSDNTLICGRNGVGKSTVRNGILWILTGKLSDGSAADNTRPHDENGKAIDYVDIVGEMVVEHEGKAITFKKTERQKWVKHRGSTAEDFEGNEVIYEINGIPKKKKDYDAFIAEIADTDTLIYGQTAQAFLGLDTKKRRSILMGLASNVSMEAIAKNDAKYAPILPILSDGTMDELIARSRKVIKGKNEDLKALPIRIDELSKMIVERDTAELELLKNSLTEALSKVEKDLSDDGNQTEIKRLEDEELRLQFDLNDCKRRANEKVLSQRHNLNKEVMDAETKLSEAKHGLDAVKSRLTEYEAVNVTDSAKIEELKSEFETAKKRTFDESKWTFDESTTICSLCGQKLPDVKIQFLRSEFESRKAEAIKKFNIERNQQIESIKTIGNKLSSDVKNRKQWIEQHQKDLEDKNKDVMACTGRLDSLKAELAKIPSEPDLSQDAEYQELSKKIAGIKVEIEKLSNETKDTSSLEDRKTQLEGELAEVNKQLAKVAQNAEIEDRITELTAKQREISQEIATEEMKRDLLEALNKEYIEVTTAEVNKHFKTVRWKMFEPNITNAGYMAVCIPTVRGADYYNGLNYSDKLLAEVDIAIAFQNVAGVELPITVDNTESIDPGRLPDVGRQMICLIRTDDKHLMVIDRANLPE